MTAQLDHYQRLLTDRTEKREHWARTEFRVSLLRLVVMVTIFAVAWFAVQRESFSLLWAALPLALFLALVSLHERVLQKKNRADQACAYYQAGVDRIEERWREASNDDGSRFRSAHHLYAEDLDILGPGSLYHLLNQTRTRAGEEVLARWLLEPAGAEEAIARQSAVAELMARDELREDMATLGSEVRSQLDPDRLAEWAMGESVLRSFAVMRWLFAAAAVSNVICAGLWMGAVTGGRPLLFSVIVSFLLFLVVRHRIGMVVSGVEKAGRDLEVVAELMDRVEREGLKAPWLARRAEELRLGGVRPGEEIRRLQKWVERLESRRNAFFAPFGALLLWTSQIAFVVEDWRQRWGNQVARWLQVVGELEAAACLATFAYERGLVVEEETDALGQVVFPTIVDVDEALFEACALGHPLIAPKDCVRNDVRLSVSHPADLEHPAELEYPVESGPGAGPVHAQALVISGSNMSGKSTFLRSCGLNVVLALAGAPVVAQSMRTSPLAVGASIRIQDSLQDGSSKFYAEIQRLRSVLDLARGAVPALCLLDEILHGTNSHDRRIGAAAVVKALLREDALVMVTTHDLVLARLTDSDDFGASASDGERDVERRLLNVHFVDTIEDGRIHFDFLLRDGVVTKSNALELMREVGLDV